MIDTILLAGILKLELPGHTVRLSDGGTLTVAGETYLSRDDLIGIAGGFEALTEGMADEAPAGMITFLPPDDTASATLLNPAWQGSRLRLWIVEVDDLTGLPIGAAEQQVDWMLDTSALGLARGRRELELTNVTSADRLFLTQRGNSLSPTFHRGVHPGEAGLDNASGVATSVPWGAPAAPRGITSAGYGGGSRNPGGGGGGNGWQGVDRV